MFRRQPRQSIVEGATYSEWVDYLDSFGRGDLRVVPVAAPLPEAIGEQAVIRLSNRAIEAMTERLLLWSKRLDRNLEHHRSAGDFERILGQSRDQIAAVWEFALTAQLPEVTLANLQSQVRDQITKTQQSLERQFEADLSRRTDYGLAVRRVSLVAVLRGEIASSTTRAQVAEASPTSPRRGRRVLIETESSPDAER